MENLSLAWPKQVTLRDPEDQILDPESPDSFQDLYVVDNSFLGINRLFFRAPNKYAGPPPLYTAFCRCGMAVAKAGDRWVHREDASPAHGTDRGPVEVILSL